MERLAVVYGKGAIHPVEACSGLSRVAEPVFVVQQSAAVQRLLPVMERLGETIVLGGDHDDNARRVAGAGVSGIVTFSESMLPLASALARSLGLPHHDPAVLDLLTDKFRQRARLREAGVDPTRSRRITHLCDWTAAVDLIGLPAVVKPVRGGGSQDTYLVSRRAPGRWVAELLARTEVVLEELLTGRDTAPYGDYVSVESAVVEAEVFHIAVTGKFPFAAPFREVGQFWPAALDAEESGAVLELAGRSIRALGVTSGLTHTEIKLTPLGPRLIEVNGRLGGHLNELSIRACGTDLVELAGRIALGHRVEPVEVRPSRVFWQYNDPAPLEPCTFVRTTGWREALAVPGVTRYTPYFRQGDRLENGVMSNPLDLICGAADDHRAMFEQLEAVLERLLFTFAFPQERTIPAALLATA